MQPTRLRFGARHEAENCRHSHPHHLIYNGLFFSTRLQPSIFEVELDNQSWNAQIEINVGLNLRATILF